MGADAISRHQTQYDPARLLVQVKGSRFDSVRWWQTLRTASEFPDTEEVTGSNPVRPTIFECMSHRGSQNGSQRGARNIANPAALTAGMFFSEGHDRAFMSAVTHRQLLQGDRPLLMLYGLHILFSQVNRDLRDMFPGPRDMSSALLTGQRFMVAGGVTGRVSN
jgi:hypothetical protein